MTPPTTTLLLASPIPGRAAGLGVGLLVLFGSRARGDARADSDWDFGYLAQPGREVDPLTLAAALVEETGSDRVDVADLSPARAGALLRFRVARDGIPLLQVEPAAFERFQIEAASFWCDAEAVLQRAYGALLDGLSP